jgi:hypothetical protein
LKTLTEADVTLSRRRRHRHGPPTGGSSSTNRAASPPPSRRQSAYVRKKSKIIFGNKFKQIKLLLFLKSFICRPTSEHFYGHQLTVLPMAKWDFSAAEALFEESLNSSRSRDQPIEPKLADRAITERSIPTFKVADLQLIL